VVNPFGTSLALMVGRLAWDAGSGFDPVCTEQPAIPISNIKAMMRIKFSCRNAISLSAKMRWTSPLACAVGKTD
jgi:hypothetical protein